MRSPHRRATQFMEIYVKALKLSYQQTDPASVLRVVKNGAA
ncbi:MAG: hypothetical protein ACHQ9S_28105 [Candidatus Binatia bacterium]